MATRSLVPETGGLPVGAIWWAEGGLVIKVEPREPPQCPRFMACGSSPIPYYGGDTAWVDLEALYNSLSQPVRALIEGLKAIHVRDDAGNGLIHPPRYDGRPTGPFASLHPLVRVHPETQRKSRFLSTGFVKAIDGLHPARARYCSTT